MKRSRDSDWLQTEGQRRRGSIQRPASYTMGTGRQTEEAWSYHSSPSGAGFKNGGAIPLLKHTPSRSGAQLIRHRDNLLTGSVFWREGEGSEGIQVNCGGLARETTFVLSWFTFRCSQYLKTERRRIVRRIMNWKGFGSRSQCPIPAFSWRKWGNHKEPQTW
jgi:hypothetical protein